MAVIRRGSTATGKLVIGPAEPITPVNLNPKPPPVMTAKATIQSYESPISITGTSRAVAKVTQGVPAKFRWQWQDANGWHTGAENVATDLDHTFNRKNGAFDNVFPRAGNYPIRLQTLDAHGAVVDQTGTIRVITVNPVQVPPIPPDPTPPEPPTPGQARTGIVHVVGAHGTADDQGRHYYGLATLFWGPWAYRMDRGKLHTNLTILAPGQLDAIRPLCHVIEPADFWGPRANDLTVPDNVVKLGDYVDECYAEFGLRQHLTIFGDTSYTRPIRSKIVDDVIAIMRPRLERIFCWEVVNEAQLLKPTPFPVDEAQEYARRIKAAFPSSLVFVSSPDGDLCNAQQAIAGDTGTSGIEPHFSRSQGGTKGVWTPVTQPWMGDGRFCSHVGPLIISGEPIGPNSSGNSDSDPTRLATMILVGGVGGLCADVFHTGTGVRGIDDPARGIPADFSGIPNLSEILEAERQARALLNQFPDMPDWTRGSSTDGPFTIKTWPDDSHGVAGTLDRAYSSWSGQHSLTACCNIRATTTFTAKKAMHVSVRHARRALDEIVSIDLAAGQSFTLDASTPGAAIVGTLR